MDQQEFGERLVALIQTSPDVATFERGALPLFMEAGYPESLAREMVEIMLTSGNDQVEMARRMGEAALRHAGRELAGDEEAGGVVELLSEVQEWLARMHHARELYDQGEFSRALAAADETLAAVNAAMIRVGADPALAVVPESPELAVLMALVTGTAGTLHYKLGNYQRAVPLLEQAIATVEAAGRTDNAGYPKMFGALGAIHATWGDAERAIEWTERAIDAQRRNIHAAVADEAQRALLEAEDSGMLELRTWLAGYHAQAGDPDRAFAMQAEILETLRKSGKGVSIESARAAQGAALSALLRGDELTANLLVTAAWSTHVSLGHGAHPDALQCALDVIELRRRAGKYEEAIRLVVDLQKTWASIPDAEPLAMARFIFEAALICGATGSHEEALTLFQQSAELHDATILRVFPAAAERQRTTFARLLRHHWYSALSLVLHHLPASPDAVRWSHDLVMRRKGILTEALASQQAAALSGKYPGMAAALEEAATLRARLAHKQVAGPGDDPPELHRAHLMELERALEQAEGALAREIPEAALAQRLLAATTQEVAAALAPESALVEYVRFPLFDFTAREAEGETPYGSPRYVAFVLTAGSDPVPVLVDLGDAVEIDALVAEWRAAVTEMPAGRAPGERLRSVVLDPVLGRVPGRTRLYLAPDGDLSTLAFDALPLGDDGYVIDEYRVSYLATGRDALRFGQPPGNPTEPVVFGDPLFDLGGESVPGFEPGTPFEALEGARLEADAVFAMLGGTAYDGEDALEHHVRSLRSPLVLHLATHGYFLPDPEDARTDSLEALLLGGRLAPRYDRLADVRNPMLRSGLALAGANGWSQGGQPPADAGDGLLSAEDVVGLDLLETQLVVLSACETGLGDVHVGEGVYGLRRAFIAAGARTLVMSLWKVPDEETRAIMTGFYTELLHQGRARGDALRAARLALRRVLPDDPFSWGAFICQGEADAGLTLER